LGFKQNCGGLSLWDIHFGLGCGVGGGEEEYGFDGAAIVGVGDGAVDLVEGVGAVEALEGESTGAVVADEAGDEALGNGVALDDFEHFLARFQAVVAGAGVGDHGDGAARGEGFDGGAEVVAVAGDFECVVDAPGCNLAQGCGEVFAAGVEGVGGTELAGEAESFGLDVDGDEGGGPANSCGHDGGESDGAGSEDGDALVGADVEGVEDGASAGLDAAAERGELGEGKCPGNFDGVAFGGDGVRGEGGLAKEVGAEAAGFEGVGAVESFAGEVEAEEVVAVGGLSAPTGGTAAAGLVGEDDVVAGTEGFDFAANAFDDARAFVAEDDVAAAGGAVEVGVADADGGDAHENFVVAGRFDFDAAEFEVIRVPCDGDFNGDHVARHYSTAASGISSLTDSEPVNFVKTHFVSGCVKRGAIR
jgi:hypothetical protein